MNEELLQLFQGFQDDVLAKFQQLKDDQEQLKLKLKNIEEKLGVTDDHEVNTQNKTKDVVDIVDEDTEIQQSINLVEDPTGYVIEAEQFDNIEDKAEDLIEEDEEIHVKTEVKLEELPISSFQGLCFRPIAGFRNSSGRSEISRERVSISEQGIELKICGFESEEEIVKIDIPLKDIDKVEAVLEERSVLFLYVTEDICSAALRSLAMTNIASFSLVDKETKKIRICFEKINDQRKALLREYFRRNAIYFRFLSEGSTRDQIFFKPMKSPLAPKYDSNKPQPLEDFVKTLKTVKFLDRVTYTCKVCDYYNQNKDSVIRHVNKYHIGNSNMSDRDVMSQFIKRK